MKLSGLPLSEANVAQKISKIIKNIDTLEKNYKALDESLIKHNKFKEFDKITDKFKKNLKKSEIDVTLVKYLPINNKFDKCENFLENCEFFDISNENLSTLLEGDLKLENKSYQYFGIISDIDNFSKSSFSNFSSLDNIKIFYDNGINIDYDKFLNLITITQNKAGAKALFYSGQIKDKKIKFQTSKLVNQNIKNTQKDYSPINKNGLTGCVTFSNLDLQNVSIEANDSTCEDAVNLINATGSLDNIKINNSFSDALDIDFSKISINNIEVLNAGNDCVDFSLGKYEVKNLILSKCGDKAVSIGERSFAQLDNMQVDTAETGLASKDSSITLIKNSSFSKLNTCLSAYNKKQEFDGAIIKFKNIRCDNIQIKNKADLRSKITNLEKK